MGGECLMKYKKLYRKPILLFILIGIIFWVIWGNKALQISNITIKSNHLPKDFDGFRIAHISDLHNTQFKNKNEELLSIIKDGKVDILAITGDLIDANHPDITVALDFVKRASKLVPCYYVSGNHEVSLPEYSAIKDEIKEAGAVVLDNKEVILQKGKSSITLIGVEDPSIDSDYLIDDASIISSVLSNFSNNKGFKILLSHRPELFDVYVENRMDVVLSGHAHGGQIRLPFLHGIIAPNQGFFPKYTSGLYAQDSTNMIVSRGLGNSILPLRINNRPEVVFVELTSG